MIRVSDLFATSFDGSEKFELPHYANEDVLDDMLVWAHTRKASDVTITSEDYAWADIGSMKHRISTRPISSMEAENFARIIYGADTAPALIQSGRDMDPTHEIRNMTATRDLTPLFRFRVNITGCRIPGGTGISFTFRSLPSTPPEVRVLGLEQEVLDHIRPPLGLNLVTGPTGSGKSTLLYSILRHQMELPTASEKLLDYSKPIEFVFDGLQFPHSFAIQTEVGRHLRDFDDGREAAQWAYATRNSLRRKPEIILIGESRDKATFAGCLENCLTGHLTFTTMHTVGVKETVRRALQFFDGSERRGVATDLLSTLNIIMTQRLVPRADGQGRVAIREYLLFNRFVRERLVEADHEDWPRILGQIMAMPRGERKTISKTLKESAYALFEEGIIDDLTYRNEGNL